jgi:hypothetical protein
MVDRSFSIVATSGETVSLSTGPTGDIALLVGVYGIGVPPVQPRYLEGAADGGAFRGKRYGMRTVDLPLYVGGGNREAVEVNLRTLARMVDETAGLPKLVATYNDGQVYELPFVYQSGLEGTGTAEFRDHTQITLSILCPDPFWTARDAVQFSVTSGGATTGLLPDLASLQIESSVVIGTFPITNPGDVECPLSWQITGPGGPASATLDGRGWTWDDTLSAGQFLSITKTTVGVTAIDSLGASRYASFDTAPKFFNLPAGESTIILTLTDATSASALSGFYRPRRKVVY